MLQLDQDQQRKKVVGLKIYCLIHRDQLGKIKEGSFLTGKKPSKTVIIMKTNTFWSLPALYKHEWACELFPILGAAKQNPRSDISNLESERSGGHKFPRQSQEVRVRLVHAQRVVVFGQSQYSKGIQELRQEIAACRWKRTTGKHRFLFQISID